MPNAGSIPDRMTVVAVEGGKGPPEVLKLVSAPTPTPARGEILIKVAFTRIGFPDILRRQGLYPMPPGAPDIKGLEVSGHVIAVGDAVDRWKIGDAVCALLIGAGYADYVAVDARHALPVPPPLTLTASSLRARSADEKARLTAAVEANVWPWIASGQLSVNMDKVFPIGEVGAAHAYLESGKHLGKVILRL